MVYAEYRFSPYLEGAKVLGEDYCEAIFAGLEKGQREFGIKVRAILVLMRNMPGE